MNLDYIKKIKVKEISDRMWEVNGHIVKWITKTGRSMLSCSCTNHSKFCNSEPLCSDKLAVLNYLFTRVPKKLIEDEIRILNKRKEINLQTNNLIFMDFLERINRNI